MIQYFLKFPRKERLKVQYVVMDMSSLFYGVAKACFPNAKIVADRYHVVCQANWAMENVRKRVQKTLSAEWRKLPNGGRAEGGLLRHGEARPSSCD